MCHFLSAKVLTVSDTFGCLIYHLSSLLLSLLPVYDPLSQLHLFKDSPNTLFYYTAHALLFLFIKS